MAPYTEPYDVADYLDNDEMISAYLTEAFESDDPHETIHTLAEVARARGGLDRLSRISGIGVEELKSALSDAGKPEYATIYKVFRALGVKLSASITSIDAIAA